MSHRHHLRQTGMSGTRGPRFLFLMSILSLSVHGCDASKGGTIPADGGGDSGVGADADTDADTDTDTDTDADSDTDTDTDVDTDTDTDGDTDSDADPDAGVDSGSDTDTDIDTDVPCVDGQTFPGPGGSVWVDLCGGAYYMGSDDGDVDEQPVHAVSITAFRIFKTEVTVSQYAECLAANACTEPDTGLKCNWNDPGYEKHPINCVDWQQAVDFCTWAGGRLPSEAEWEFAARSRGKSIRFPWGDDPSSCDLAVMDDDGEGCGTGRTMGVGEKAAGDSEQGISDMAGNVWEWVQDWYHKDYEGVFQGPPTDGSAWEKPEGTSRVRRGGSFLASEAYLRSTDRGSSNPSYRGTNLGLRCAR